VTDEPHDDSVSLNNNSSFYASVLSLVFVFQHLIIIPALL